jgi:hypothetical protein
MIPTSLRHPSLQFVDNTFHPRDVLNNILLYLPLGVALVGSSFVQTLFWGLCVSGLAETLQLGYIDRTPSLADVAANTAGALIGYAVARMFVRARTRRPLSIPIPRGLAIAAIPVAILGTLALLHNQPGHDFSNWNPNYQLAVGDELDGGRTWDGTLSALAIYPFAMPPSEIEVLARLGRVYPAGSGQTPIFGPLGADELKARFRQPLLSAEQQQALFSGLTFSNQMTVLVVMQTPNLTQKGPSRIVTYSSNAWSRNFTLGQNLNALTLRLRTPSTGGNGTDPALYTGPVLEANRPAMIAAVYDGRISKIYVDGKLKSQADLGVKRPRFPRHLVMMLPSEIPLREVELVTAEVVLSGLLALGLFGQFGVPRPLLVRYLFGFVAGAAVALVICAFAVSQPGLGLRIVCECIAGGLAVSASMEPELAVR